MLTALHATELRDQRTVFEKALAKKLICLRIAKRDLIGMAKSNVLLARNSDRLKLKNRKLTLQVNRFRRGSEGLSGLAERDATSRGSVRTNWPYHKEIAADQKEAEGETAMIPAAHRAALRQSDKNQGHQKPGLISRICKLLRGRNGKTVR